MMMSWLKELFLRLRSSFRSAQIEREIDDEIRFHLEMRTQENIDSGMTSEEAKRDALRRFGNQTHIKEISREIRGGFIIETLLQDLRYGIRMLLKQPIFTAVAVITLALGIGANTIVFSIVDTVLLKPLPFKDSDRLVLLWETDELQQKKNHVSSPGNFIDWKSQSSSFEEVAAYFKWTFNLTGIDDPERIDSAVVMGNLFQLLGVNAKMGRILLPEDDRQGNDAVVVLGYRLWQGRFGGDLGIIDKKITLNGQSFTVVGVMPQSFKFPDEETEIWVPAGFGAKQLQDRRGKFINVIARLKEGIDLNQAQAEMNGIAARLEQEHPETNTGWKVKIARLDSVKVEKIKSALLVLLGAVSFVLLIACVNVACLLLARGASRQREFSIRIALGASRTRLFSQLLTEGLLLAILGGFFGLLLASGGLSIITSINPGDIPRLNEVIINSRVLGFTLALSVISVMVFGFAPAVFASNSNPQESLKTEVRARGGSRLRLRDLLVVSEIALAMVLLVGAGLMMKSFFRLQSVVPGFRTDNLLTLIIWLPSSRYAENQQQIAFFQQLIEKIETIPGVESAAAIQDLPLRRNRMGHKFVIEGHSIPSGSEPDAAYRVVTPDYFSVMGIPLQIGRLFTENDDEQTSRVVIINESMARQFWASEDPVGKRIRFGGDDAPWYSIVGVVGDVKHMGLDAEEGPAIYQPHAQKPQYLRWMTVVLRTNVEPLSLAGAIRNQVRAIDKDQPVYDIATMEQLLSESISNPKLYMALLGLFAFIALLLAMVGIYSLLAFWVTQRAREIGIHIALGAQRKDVVRLVLGKGFKLSLSGILLGLSGAFALTRFLRSFLFEISATDPATFAAISILLMLVAVLACYFPARRAMKVDPIIALRNE
jgi:putative ABC transport system permease protein